MEKQGIWLGVTLLAIMLGTQGCPTQRECTAPNVRDPVSGSCVGPCVPGFVGNCIPIDASRDAAEASVEAGPTCGGGMLACGGGCVAADSIANCGACGRACSAPAGGRATCSAGSCDFACDAPAVRVGASCDLPVPRQLSPMSGATTTSGAPTLLWESPAGLDGASVDLCRDRTMTMGCQTLRGSTSSVRPASALVPGWWFWRVRGMAGSMSSARTSPVWQFRAGIDPRHTPVDSSWGSVSDLDGDGHPELLQSTQISGSGNGEVRIIRGPVSAASTASTWTLRSPSTDVSGYGLSVRNLGDVNGDGFIDLGVVAPLASGGAGRVFIYFGASEGPSSTPSQQIESPDGAGSALGLYVAISVFADGLIALGDKNGDGYSDIAISSLPMGQGQPGRYILGLGSASGIQLQRENFVGPSPNLVSLLSAGDVNGDRIADAVEVSTVAGAPTELRLRVLLGSRTPAMPPAPREIAAPPMSTPKYEVLSAGSDLDADGLADVVFSSENSSCAGCRRISVWRGNIVPGTQYEESGPSIPAVTNGFWSGLQMVGDINGDGYGDIALSHIGYMATNQIEFYLGSASLLSSASALTIPDPIATQLGDQLLLGPRVDDLDGDGFADVLFRTIHGTAPQVTRWYAHRGSATPDTSLTWAALLPTDNTVQIGF